MKINLRSFFYILWTFSFLETRGILDTGLIENLSERVRTWLGKYRLYSYASLPGITCAASLAHHGLLGSVQGMWLSNVDLTSIPAQHLASLASSVMMWVGIEYVSGCGLVTILDSAKIKWLDIRHQSLGSEETQALVRAMEFGVEKVELHEEATLDIRDLMEYSGQGKCRQVVCYRDAVGRYREQLETWATNKNWRVDPDNDDFEMMIERNYEILK